MRSIFEFVVFWVDDCLFDGGELGVRFVVKASQRATRSVLDRLICAST